MSEGNRLNLSWAWFILLGICIVFLGYLTNRTDHTQLLLLLLFGFVAAWRLYRSGLPVTYLVAGGMILRLSLLLMWPNLSEDIYRYIWDGQLLLHGNDPFAYVPSHYADSGTWPEGTTEALYNRLNSKDYFSVYPPVAQYMFVIVGWLGGSSVFLQLVIFRVFVILAEGASCLMLYRMQKESGTRNTLLYALNPAVILELTGNLHLEALLLPLLLLLLRTLKRSIPAASVTGAFAIGVKLVPVILMPLILFRSGWKKGFLFAGVTLVTISALFYPVISGELLRGMGSSIGLYFRKFEFNASVYYILREIGFWRRGYNQIAEIGPALGLVSFICISAYSWAVRKDAVDRLPVHFGVVLTIYLLLSTTVHPWYVLPITGLLCLSNYTYAFIWSFAVMWTYAGYQENTYELPVIAILVEYLVVFTWMIYEIRNENKSAGKA